MLTTIEAKDIVLEEDCRHWKGPGNPLLTLNPESYWESEECPHCLGTGIKPTELGVKVLEFVLRNSFTHQIMKDELHVLYKGYWRDPEEIAELRKVDDRRFHV